jgi:hypothetical protein
VRERSPVVSFIAADSAGRRRTADSERIPALLSLDDFGSSVERATQGQVLWRVRVKVAGGRWKLRTAVGLVREDSCCLKAAARKFLHITQGMTGENSRATARLLVPRLTFGVGHAAPGTDGPLEACPRKVEGMASIGP